MKHFVGLIITLCLVAAQDVPRFVSPVANWNVTVGREAILPCSVENLGSYKVAWVRVDTQTILTIHTHVITRNHRIDVSHPDSRTWNLHITNVKGTDRGYYTCQINTDPMMSQTGYLQVVDEPVKLIQLEPDTVPKEVEEPIQTDFFTTEAPVLAPEPREVPKCTSTQGCVNDMLQDCNKAVALYMPLVYILASVLLTTRQLIFNNV